MVNILGTTWQLLGIPSFLASIWSPFLYKMVLNRKESRLDMIDNKHLTSFPLIHPGIIPEQSSPSRIVSTCTMSDEPLALIEDYVEIKGPRKSMSVMDFKARKSCKSSIHEKEEPYLQSVPDGLKYCVICEKPLYELSTLIPEQKYREIVCCDCFAEYESIWTTLNVGSGLIRRLREIKHRDDRLRNLAESMEKSRKPGRSWSGGSFSSKLVW